MRKTRDRRLDPVRWRRPRGSTLVRGTLVAILLLAAAGVAFGAPGPEPPAGSATGADGPGSIGEAGGPDGADERGGVSGADDAGGADRGGAGDVGGVGGVDHRDHPATPGSAADGMATDGETSVTAPVTGRLPIPRGTFGVPVRLAEPSSLAAIRPGDRVDLLVARDDRAGEPPRTLATGVVVLWVPAAPGDLDPVVYLALDQAQARATAGLPPDVRFAVIVRTWT